MTYPSHVQESGRYYAELPRPGGRTYEDGSCDLLISVEHPATLPTRVDRVSLHVDGADVDIDAASLVWLAEQTPKLLALIRRESGDAA